MTTHCAWIDVSLINLPPSLRLSLRLSALSTILQSLGSVAPSRPLIVCLCRSRSPHLNLISRVFLISARPHYKPLLHRTVQASYFRQWQIDTILGLEAVVVGVSLTSSAHTAFSSTCGVRGLHPVLDVRYTKHGIPPTMLLL